MELFLARAWGLYLVIIAASLLLNRESAKRLIKAARKASFLYMAAFLALVVGILQVLSYNVWVAEWKVILTVFGWASLLKGTMLLVWPGYARGLGKHIKQTQLNIYLALALMLGAFLLYKGFIAGISPVIPGP